MLRIILGFLNFPSCLMIQKILNSNFVTVLRMKNLVLPRHFSLFVNRSSKNAQNQIHFLLTGWSLVGKIIISKPFPLKSFEIQ